MDSAEHKYYAMMCVLLRDENNTLRARWRPRYDIKIKHLILTLFRIKYLIYFQHYSEQ